MRHQGVDTTLRRRRKSFPLSVPLPELELLPHLPGLLNRQLTPVRLLMLSRLRLVTLLPPQQVPQERHLLL